MISTLKIYLRFIIYFFLNLFITPSKVQNKKTILLMRLDAIGDYILFRNYIELLKKSDKYKQYSITLLGNTAFKTIANELDKKNIDNFIWIDLDKFNKNLFYRYDKLKEVTSVGYEVLISPVFSRNFFVVDNFVKLINAKHKIGSVGNLSNIKKWQKRLSDKYYDILIPVNSNILFEFLRNKEFFEALLSEKIDMKKPYIFLEDKKQTFKLPKKYAILFIGGSSVLKKWDAKNFTQIGKYLKDRYSYEIVICGSVNDKKEASKFNSFFKDSYIDLVGKTSLVEFFYLLSDSDLIVSNETSAPHIAVALDVKKIFVIYSGIHYCRFAPYPNEISENYHIICDERIKKDTQNYKILSNSYGYTSKFSIDDITVDMVKKQIDKVLDEKH